MSKVAVVILNYNGREYLEKFLPSVITNSPNADLIVADNHSNDDSLEFLQKEFPDIRRIALPTNLGYAGGYNEALKQIEAKYYVLLNSDVEVSSQWLDPLTQFLDDHPTYAACQPKILSFNDRTHFEYAGACGGFLDALGYPYCRGRIFNELEEDGGQYNEPIDVAWTSGACMFIRSNVFHELNGFDPDLFAHMEEIDLCWRATNKGHKLANIPASMIYHVGGGTLSKTSPRKTYLNFRNGLHLLIKNLPAIQLTWKLPLRVLFDWMAAIKFLFDGSASHALAVYRAHFNVLFTLPKTIKKRTRPFLDITGNGYITIQHYINGKKKYSEL